MAEAKMRELDAAHKEASTPAPDVRPDGKDRFKVFDAERGFCGTVEIDSTITVVWLATPLRGERRRFSQRDHAIDYLRLVRKLNPQPVRKFPR